jgi:AcrR family transcriptional regulator
LFDEAEREGLFVNPVTSREQVPLRQDAFFSTLAFPSLAALSQTVSIHVHVAVSDVDDMLTLYRNLCHVATEALQRSSVLVDGAPVRRELLEHAFSPLQPLIRDPLTIGSLADFERMMVLAAQQVDASLGPELRAQLIERFPHMFDRGHIRIITPDKVFSLARIRPDLRNNGFVGSVEFRAYDGQPTFQRDMDLVMPLVHVNGVPPSLAHVNPVSVGSDVEIHHLAYRASLEGEIVARA